jgi:mitogen-activated protein kinase kinase kinase 1
MCGDEQVLLDQMGDDLTLGYVKTFAQESVKTEATHFAQGGFGRIYKGVLEGTVPVVVKELIVEGSAEMKLFAELQHEVSVMSKLHHENVVQLYGIMLGPLRMVLELCNEGDLIYCLSNGKVKTQKLKVRIG